MKKLFYLFLVISFFISLVQNIYASEIDDILRNLESPEVNYRIENEIKIITPKQTQKAIQPNTYFQKNNKNIKPLANQELENKSYEKTNIFPNNNQKPITIEKKQNNNKEKVLQTNQNKEKAQDLNRDEKKYTSTPSSKNNLKQNKQEETSKKIPTPIKQPIKQNNIQIDIYKLYSFFKNLEVTKYWVDGTNENWKLCKKTFQFIYDNTKDLKTDQVSKNKDTTKAKSDKEDSKDGGKEDSEENDEEDEDSEEEEEKVDYSKYNDVIAKAQNLYENGKWTELEDLFAENNEAGSAPAAQKYKVMLEYRKDKPNINLIRSYSATALEDNPNSPEGNFGMAYYLYNRKKPDINNAKKHLEKAINCEKPLKEAIEFANKMKSNIWIYILIIFVFSLTGIGVFFFIKLKKKKNKGIDNTTESEEFIEENITDSESEEIIEENITNSESESLQEFESTQTDNAEVNKQNLEEIYINDNTQNQDSPKLEEQISDEDLLNSLIINVPQKEEEKTTQTPEKIDESPTIDHTINNISSSSEKTEKDEETTIEKENLDNIIEEIIEEIIVEEEDDDDDNIEYNNLNDREIQNQYDNYEENEIEKLIEQESDYDIKENGVYSGNSENDIKEKVEDVEEIEEIDEIDEIEEEIDNDKDDYSYDDNINDVFGNKVYKEDKTENIDDNFDYEDYDGKENKVYDIEEEYEEEEDDDEYEEIIEEIIEE